jgi:hypothetical protein
VSYGLQIYNASGGLVYDSTTAPAGVVANVLTVAASSAPTYTFPAFAGYTLRLVYTNGGAGLWGYTVDYALGYPRVVFSSAGGSREFLLHLS